MPKYLVEIPVLKLRRVTTTGYIDIGTKEYSEKELVQLLSNALFRDGLENKFLYKLDPQGIKVHRELTPKELAALPVNREGGPYQI